MSGIIVGLAIAQEHQLSVALNRHFAQDGRQSEVYLTRTAKGWHLANNDGFEVTYHVNEERFNVLFQGPDRVRYPLEFPARDMVLVIKAIHQYLVEQVPMPTILKMIDAESTI